MPDDRLFTDLTDHTHAQREFAHELTEVEQHLRDATADLFPPFSQMVATVLRNSQPYLRAAIVLAAGVAAPDTPTVRSQRIFLAAALEMLHLALAVHMKLSEAATDNTLNRSLLGSTILAGDYCFSRSAGLAVRTGDARVVEIFSEALKQVSEGHLRRFLDPTGSNYDENRELFLAGVSAAMHLTQATEQARAAGRHLAEVLADAPTREPLLPALPPLLDVLTPHQGARWLAMVAWRHPH